MLHKWNQTIRFDIRYKGLDDNADYLIKICILRCAPTEARARARARARDFCATIFYTNARPLKRERERDRERMHKTLALAFPLAWFG